MSFNFILLKKERTKKIPCVPPLSDFPTDILKWMKMNNTKPKMLLKFMQICQYFQLEEFPYSVVVNLCGHCKHNLSHWSYQPLGFNVVLNVRTFKSPLWILKSLSLTKYDKLPEIAVCDLRKLTLTNVDMSFSEFKILTSAGKVEQFELSDSVIRDENGEILSFETIFQCLPNINSHKNADSVFSLQVSSRFLESNFQKESYSIEKCFNFFQNNQYIFFNFSFNGPKKDEFTQRLQNATDKILEAWSPKNKPPTISFEGQTSESTNCYKNLQKLFEGEKQ